VDKRGWRAWAAQQPAVTAEESAQLVEVLAEEIARRRALMVLTFLSLPNEVDLGRLLDTAGINFCTTRTPADGDLTVHRLPAELEQHPFGFLQPVPTTPSVELDRVDMALVPGVVFDRSGVRIGHGMGYYDRLLPRLVRAHRVGVTVDRLVVETLPAGESDVKMHALATESGYREIH
jgi:5-formyltetrahydrofolate cyclo-ligase